MNDLQITPPATPWAFLTVFHRPAGDHEEGETSVWAFGDMAATHEAESIIESISGVDFTRRRSAEISPIEVENLWTACGTAANDTGELLSALSARGEVA